MDEKLYHMIVKRIDRVENKVDQLLEFKWKVVGIALAVGTIAGVFSRYI